MPKLKDIPTTRRTSKLWITPENEVVPLRTWHYEYFRDHPQIAAKYGVVFRDEQTTRLDALRVGFVRVNYERNGGLVTIETIRWDRQLRNLIDGLILENEDALDMVRIHKVDQTGQAIQVGCVSLMDLRKAGRPITRLTMGSWDNLRVTRL